MPLAVTPDRLDAIGVALSAACLGHGVAVPADVWTSSGHLAFALALVPVAAWAAARGFRKSAYASAVVAFCIGVGLTLVAVAGPALGLDAPVLRAAAAAGAAALATGHLLSGHATSP